MSTDKDRVKSAIKFIACSIFGIIMFFVKIPFGAKSEIPINYIVNLLKVALAPYLKYIVLAISIYGVIDTVFIKKDYKKKGSDALFVVIKVIGLILIALTVFQVGPQVIIRADVGPNVVNVLAMAVTLTVLIGSLILPFLIDYGFADAVGVLLRPIMRPIFKIPGKTAVIAITAYLGNYSLGHIGVDKMLKNGELTKKESVIVGTGFATASVVNFMAFAGMMGLMDQWGKFFIAITLITFIITAISVRLYPIANKSNDYYEGVEPQPESEFNENIFKNAFNEGVRVASAAKPIYKTLLTQVKAGFNILAGLLPAAMFFMVVALILQLYTPIFTWIGYIFWPFLKLMGVGNLDVLIPAIGTGVVDLMMVPSMGIQAYTQGTLSLTARYILAGLPVTEIVFMSGFIPCILATKIPIKFHELIIMWVIRVILSILLIGLFGLIFL